MINPWNHHFLNIKEIMRYQINNRIIKRNIKVMILCDRESAHIIILIRRIDSVLFFLCESKVEVREKQRYGPLNFFRIYFCFFEYAVFECEYAVFLTFYIYQSTYIRICICFFFFKQIFICFYIRAQKEQ